MKSRYDDSEKFVYRGRPDTRPWFLTGVLRPASSPRDVIWNLSVNDGATRLRLTLDLRTLKLYAAFETIDIDTEATWI